MFRVQWWLQGRRCALCTSHCFWVNLDILIVVSRAFLPRTLIIIDRLMAELLM